MNTYSIPDIAKSTDRYKVYSLYCNIHDLSKSIAYIQSESINVVNIGYELAKYIDSLNDYSYLYIDVYDYLRKLLDKSRSQINGIGNHVLAIYNLGILLEPQLELNSVQLIKEFSKSSALIIIWEHLSEMPDRLSFPTQKNNVFLDFSDVQLKELQYAL